MDNKQEKHELDCLDFHGFNIGKLILDYESSALSAREVKMNWEMLAYVGIAAAGIMWMLFLLWLMIMITRKKLNNAEKRGDKKK